MVPELGEVRAQALFVAHQETLAAQPEQVRERNACVRGHAGWDRRARQPEIFFTNVQHVQHCPGRCTASASRHPWLAGEPSLIRGLEIRV